MARLEPEDALAVDNQALAWLAERKQRRLVLVSPVKELREELERVSNSIPGLSLTFKAVTTIVSAAVEEQYG